MDAEMMRVRVEEVWKPYATETNRKSMPFPDDLVCHKTAKLEEYLKLANITKVMIPRHYNLLSSYVMLE